MSDLVDNVFFGEFFGLLGSDFVGPVKFGSWCHGDHIFDSIDVRTVRFVEFQS